MNTHSRFVHRTPLPIGQCSSNLERMIGYLARQPTGAGKERRGRSESADLPVELGGDVPARFDLLRAPVVDSP